MGKLNIELESMGSTKVKMVVKDQPEGLRGANEYFNLGDVMLLSLAGPEINTKMKPGTIMVWTWGIANNLDDQPIVFDFMTQANRDSGIKRILDCVRLFNESREEK